MDLAREINAQTERACMQRILGIRKDRPAKRSFSLSIINYQLPHVIRAMS